MMRVGSQAMTQREQLLVEELTVSEPEGHPTRNASRIMVVFDIHGFVHREFVF